MSSFRRLASSVAALVFIAAHGALGAQELSGTLVVANRTAARADTLAERQADLGPVTACDLASLVEAGPFDLVINATSLGHDGRAPELAPGLFRDDGRCYDMNYGTASGPLRDHCRALGVDYTDGLGMLVGQAARSFRIWTGREPDTAPVLDDLRAGE